MSDRFAAAVKVDPRRANATIGNVVLQFPPKTSEDQMLSVLDKVLRPELKAATPGTSPDVAATDGVTAGNGTAEEPLFDIRTRRQVFSKSAAFAQFDKVLIEPMIAGAKATAGMSAVEWNFRLRFWPPSVLDALMKVDKCGEQVCSPGHPCWEI